MAAEWFCEISGKPVGPLSSDQLKAMADSGRLTPQDRVRQGWRGAWVAAGRVKGLFAADDSRDGTSDSNSTVVPTAKAIRKTPAGPAAKARPPARRAVKPVDVPVAQPIARPANPPPVKRARVPRAEAPAVPPPPPKVPATAPPSSDQFNIVTETGTPRARSTGKGIADTSAPQTRRRNNALVAGLLIVLVVGLAAAGIVLAVVGNPFTKPFTKPSAKQVAGTADDGDENVEDLDLGGPAAVGSSRPDPGAAGPSDAPAGRRWVDASKDPIQRGGVEVRVSSTEIGFPRVLQASGRPARPKRPCLLIAVELANTGVGQKSDYTSWGGNAPMSRQVKLTDNFGKTYAPKNFGSARIDGQLASAPIDVNERIHDLLVFEAPAERAEFLMLELPAAAFGRPGALCFKIPSEMIREAESEPRPLAPPPTGSRPGGPDDGPGRPMSGGIGEIERGIEELQNTPRPVEETERPRPEKEKHPQEKEDPFREDDDPDGDVSKIIRDIEELGKTHE